MKKTIEKNYYRFFGNPAQSIVFHGHFILTALCDQTFGHFDFQSKHGVDEGKKKSAQEVNGRSVTKSFSLDESFQKAFIKRLQKKLTNKGDPFALQKSALDTK